MAKITSTRNVGSSGLELTNDQINRLRVQAGQMSEEEAFQRASETYPYPEETGLAPVAAPGGQARVAEANPFAAFAAVQPTEYSSPAESLGVNVAPAPSAIPATTEDSRTPFVGPSEQSLRPTIPEEYANTPFENEQGQFVTDPAEKQRLYDVQTEAAAQAVTRPNINVDLTKSKDIRDMVGSIIPSSDQGKVQDFAVRLSDKLAQTTTKAESGGVLNTTSENTSPNQSGWNAVSSVLGSEVDPREALTASVNAITTVSYEMLGEEARNQAQNYQPNESGELSIDEFLVNEETEDPQVVSYGLTPELFNSRVGGYVKEALRNSRLAQGQPTTSIDAADPELLGSLVGQQALDLSEFKIIKNEEGENVVYPTSVGRELIRANVNYAVATVGPTKLPRITIPAVKGKEFLPAFLSTAREPTKKRIKELDKKTKANQEVNEYGVRLDRVSNTSTPAQVGIMSLLIRLGTSDFEGADVFANALGIGTDKVKQLKATGISDKKVKSHLAQEQEKAIRALLNYAQIHSSGQGEYGRKSVDATTLRFYETNTRVDVANPYNRALQNFKSEVKIRIPKNAFDNLANISDKYSEYMLKGGTSKGVPADPQLAAAHFLFAASSVVLGEQSRNIVPKERLKRMTPEIINEAVNRGNMLKSITQKLSLANPETGLSNIEAVKRFSPTLDDRGKLPYDQNSGEFIITPMESEMPQLTSDEAQFLTNLVKNTKLKELGFHISTLVDLANMNDARINGTYYTPTGVNDMDLNAGGPTVVDFMAGNRENALHAGILVDPESLNTLELGDTRQYFVEVLDDYLGDSRRRNKLFKRANVNFSDIPMAAQSMQEGIAKLSQADAKAIAKSPQTIDAYGFPVNNHGNTARNVLENYPDIYEALAPFYTFQGEVDLTSMSEDFSDMFAAVLSHNRVEATNTGVKRAMKSVQRFGEFLAPKDMLGLSIPVGSEGLTVMSEGQTIVVTDAKGNETRVPNKERGKDLLRHSKSKKVKDASGNTILYSSPEGSLSILRMPIITGQRGEAHIVRLVFKEVNPDINNKLTAPANQIFDNINASSSSYGNYYFAANRPGGAVDQSFEFNQLKSIYDNYSENVSKINNMLRKMYEEKTPFDIGRNGPYSYFMSDADANHRKMLERQELGESDKYFKQYDKIFRAMGWISPEERGATSDNPTLNFNLDIDKMLKSSVTISRGGAGDPAQITMPAVKALFYMDNVNKYKEDLYSRVSKYEANKKEARKVFKGFLN